MYSSEPHLVLSLFKYKNPSFFLLNQNKFFLKISSKMVIFPMKTLFNFFCLLNLTQNPLLDKTMYQSVLIAVYNVVLVDARSIERSMFTNHILCQSNLQVKFDVVGNCIQCITMYLSDLFVVLLFISLHFISN